MAMTIENQAFEPATSGALEVEPAISALNWQPVLQSSLLRLRPLTPDDFEPLYAVGSDPKIWEQHPEHDRYKLDKFTRYFQSGLDSGGAFAVIDRRTGYLIGSSRFTRHDPADASIEIGYTFLSRQYWGTGHNRELKAIMLEHAFKFVDTVLFYVGESNWRSRRAVEKLGASVLKFETSSQPGEIPLTSVVYQVKRLEWLTAALGHPPAPRS